MFMYLDIKLKRDTYKSHSVDNKVRLHYTEYMHTTVKVKMINHWKRAGEVVNLYLDAFEPKLKAFLLSTTHSVDYMKA